MKKILISIIAMLLPLMARSATNINGILYVFDSSNKTAKVTCDWGLQDNSKGTYSGRIYIPSQVTYNGVTYNVTTIGNSAFEYCDKLTSVTIPSSVTTIGSYAFSRCYKLTSIIIPNGVTTIGEETFFSCINLSSITIPNSVTSIEKSAFGGCSSLTSINIPNSVMSIGSLAFAWCVNLSSISFPYSVNSIGGSAFLNTAWYDNQPDGLVYAGKVAYKYKGTMPENSSIMIKDGTLGIAESAFSDCAGLVSITIPNSVTSIGRHAFLGTGWYNNQSNGIVYLDNWLIGYKGDTPTGDIVITNNTRSIADYAFYGCSGLTSITIPNSVTSIGRGAFQYCSGLTSITIPNSVTSIGGCAFDGCSGLTSITIPNSVTSIGEYAFRNCSGLTSVVSLNNEPLKCDDMNIFYNVDMNSCKLWVPKGSLDAYKNADVWKDFQDIKELAHGDVNLDSEVNHSDLNALVDYVMGKKDPEDFNKSLGDLNGDEKVDAADVVMLVDAIMKADECSKNKAPANVEVIDLGLPKGTMWANMNIGAESPEDCGFYFAWGETTGYTSDTSDGRSFDWASYKWMNEGESTGGQVNKYQIAEGHTGSCWYNDWAEFIGDGKTKLDLEDDAAYVNWGSNWRMPTCYDFQELFENTTYEWTTSNGVNGLKFTSIINGKSIFLPAAGDRDGSGFYDLSAYGCYWSSTLHEFDSSCAPFLIFNSVSSNPISIADRFYGFTVRPVLRNKP